MLFKISFILICFAVAHTAPIDDSNRISGRIIGGNDTTIDQFPYQASVQYNSFHTCGGVIIDTKTILTTAYCVVGFVLQF